MVPYRQIAAALAITALADTPAAREAAINVATARAKRNIVEFLANDLKESQTVSNIAKAADSDKSYAQEVAERISIQSQAIIRGSFVSKQSLEDGVASVEVSVTRSSVDAAIDLANAMKHGGFERP